LRRLLRVAALLVAAWLGLATPYLCVAEPVAAEREEEVAFAPECPPFEPTPLPPREPTREPGIAPSPDAALPRGAPLATLAAPAAEAADVPAGEALLALPKRADGAIVSGFQLAPGARVASSYFSPILCSTIVRIVGPRGADADALVSRVPKGGAVVRNDVYRSAAAEVRPVPGAADPYRNLQYGLDQAQVDAARAVSTGAGARVALLDSAADAGHVELARVRIVEAPGGPEPKPATHGSMLAGIVGAIDHNGVGIEGAAPGAELLSIPVCAPVAAGTTDECRLADVLRGVDLAWEQKAQLLNVSLVGPANPLLRRAMDRLDQLGVIVVAAVGNEGTDAPRYPAAYPSVIGVGAVDRQGAPYVRGNRGAAVEVLAPGVEIVSSVPGNGFAFGDGTSLAAAHVSGVLALAVAASGDALAARTAFFQIAQERGAMPVSVPPVCEVLARLGRPCP
jgi:subtilisin family serine protease